MGNGGPRGERWIETATGNRELVSRVLAGSPSWVITFIPQLGNYFFFDHWLLTPKFLI